MIALDNGPAGGDYARYIDDLLERRAAAPLLPNAGFASTFVDPRAAGVARSSGTSAGTAFTASGRDTPPTPAQAAAIASALAMGAGASSGGPGLEVVGVLIGIAIVVVGILVPSFNGLFVLAGVGLVFAMLRRLGRRAAILRMPPGIDRAAVGRTALQRSADRRDARVADARKS